ncbi:MAG: bifunctional ADP-heptose synthase [Thermoanaerobaculales bacterium]|jgi:rfaE bifunctional protein kinase chain/domain|nr:bifunctional ADP-heptose synthase [Thermoanaerobaculales bacterium]
MPDQQRLLDIIDRFSTTRVALTGDLVLDRFILGTPKRISREAPVIILRHEGQRDVPGGAANALANMAALGLQVTALGAVGDDEPGRALSHALAARGIDTGSLLVVPGYSTPTKVRILGGGASSLKHQVARYDIEDELPDGGDWHRELLTRLGDVARGCPAIAISDYGYGFVRPDVVGAMRDAVGSEGWITLDSRYRIGEFVGVDGATPNLEELEAAVGRRLHNDDDVALAAAELGGRLGARFLLATRGNQGMTLASDIGDAVHVPVFGSDEVADVTGAGDTVLAVLTASLAAGATPVEGARLANVAAGLVVMKLGTATVTAAELARAIRGGGA